MYNNVSKHFHKDKSLETKEARAQSLWRNVHAFVKGLLGQLKQYFPQTAMNGVAN